MVEFPDPEKLICSYLPGALAATGEAVGQGVLVDIAIPNPRRPRMSIVEADGGKLLMVVLKSARVRIRSFANSETEANDLASLVEGVLPGIVGEHVNQVRPSGLAVHFPDPSEQFGRLQWFDFILIGTDKE